MCYFNDEFEFNFLQYFIHKPHLIKNMIHLCIFMEVNTIIIELLDFIYFYLSRIIHILRD